MPDDKNNRKLDSASKAMFEEGIKARREVLGDAHVDRSLRNATEFSLPIQQLATEVGWGVIWTRPGISRKTRSYMNIGMLCALGKSHELGVHVRGAVRNGLTEEEIQEALLHATVYSGFPAGLEAFRVAGQVLEEMKKSGELRPKAKL
ncbi:CMD-domain-containing protein [Rhizodiscina lignyota]|uniref:CMD-domain-containing protein n=1 Tax=Rhizodiscina lignyota TaxID=1504668 RepID=A0A9P4IFM3_9PEZI|nr:CMD-domain-containing protein [Rhizodiscina lignyota]